MPFRYRTVGDLTSGTIFKSGEELLQLWLDTGSIGKTIKVYNTRHPKDQIKYLGGCTTRIRRWSLTYPDKAIKMIQDRNPEAKPEYIQETVVTWGTRCFTWKRFQKWLDLNPWAKQFEVDYKRWYNVD